MADHVHACNRCSCRWDCDAKSCRNTYRGVCFWCKAVEAGRSGQPQIPHDHEWAGGDNCSICEDYERGRKSRSGPSLVSIICILTAAALAVWLFGNTGQ